MKYELTTVLGHAGSQFFHFAAGQYAPLSDRQIADADGPDGRARQFQHLAVDSL